MLNATRLAMAQLIACRISESDVLVSAPNTFAIAIRAPGATPTTMPETLVPWPLLSSCVAVPLRSMDHTTLQAAGTPGAVQAPNSGKA